jgi:hypothetical protein
MARLDPQSPEGTEYFAKIWKALSHGTTPIWGEKMPDFRIGAFKKLQS